MIPTIIHQIWWRGYNNLPPNFKKNRDILIKNHDDFEYKLWDEDSINQLILNNFINISNKINSLNLSIIQKIDIAKYLILYKYGGIYIDFDMIFVKNIKPLFENNGNNIIFFKINFNVNWIESLFLKIINKKILINNGFMISPINKIFWIDLVEDCLNSCEKKNILNYFTFTNVFNTTGPFILSKNIEKTIENFIIKDHNVCEPCFPLIDCDIDEKTFLIHKHKLSWLIGELSEKNNFKKIIIRSIFVLYGKIRERINLITILTLFYSIPILILILGPRKRIYS